MKVSVIHFLAFVFGGLIVVGSMLALGHHKTQPDVIAKNDVTPVVIASHTHTPQAVSLNKSESCLYHASGAVAAKGESVDGKRVGRWMFYYENKKLSSEGSYNDQGLKTGLWTSYYQNGNKKFEGEFENDQPVGIWVLFPDASSSSFFWTGAYDKAGGRVGEWKGFYNDTLVLSCFYNNDKLVQRQTYSGFDRNKFKAFVWDQPGAIRP